MLYVDGNTIRLTRGDTAYLTVPITRDGEEYVVQATDTLTFTVKRRVDENTPILQKVVTGDNLIHIEPVDTSKLSFGSYKYDIQLNTGDGDVFTVIDVSTFDILPEVTC